MYVLRVVKIENSLYTEYCLARKGKNIDITQTECFNNVLHSGSKCMNYELIMKLPSVRFALLHK